MPPIANIGLDGFARDLARAGTAVAHVDWALPACGDAKLYALLAKLDGDPPIEAANHEPLSRFLKADPVLILVVRADSVLPGLGE